MTVWLQRQEAVDRFTAYLDWCKHDLKLQPHLTIRPTTVAAPTAESAEITRVAAPPLPLIPAALPATGTPAAAITYKIAKAHPAELRNIPLSSITAPETRRPCNFMPQSYDRFDLFKRITLTLPSIRQVSDAKLKNVVRASPPVAAVEGTRKTAERVGVVSPMLSR
ncbi:hypothetical protein B0H10DRAFT_2141767 [Mycena sp. CBHHK59/15]|nr:hypothetical protein B0H10DRAFT_2141767 [Mycena sp. CBHHK59/15]